MPARLLIVDDHPRFRASARRLLERAGYVVVGEAADGAGGLDAVQRLRPDVVLLDVQLPDLDGFTVAERLAERDDPPAVVLCSDRDPGDLEALVERSAARGFVPKEQLSAASLESLLAPT